MTYLISRFVLLCLVLGAGRAALHGDAQAIVVLLLIVALWNASRILNFVADRLA